MDPAREQSLWLGCRSVHVYPTLLKKALNPGILQQRAPAKLSIVSQSRKGHVRDEAPCSPLWVALSLLLTLPAYFVIWLVPDQTIK